LAQNSFSVLSKAGVKANWPEVGDSRHLSSLN